MRSNSCWVIDLNQRHAGQPVSNRSPVISRARTATEDDARCYPESTTVHAAVDALACLTVAVPHDGRPLVLRAARRGSAPRAWPEATPAYVRSRHRSDNGIGTKLTRLVEPRHAARMREAGAAGGTTTDPYSSDPAIATVMGRESITATGPT
jgi:hypothetical protein